MAAAKQYTWVCPECGVGARGPKAPRLDATVRFCLPCSAKSPTLVARTCPVLDRQREEKAARREAKAKRQGEARRARKQAASESTERKRKQRTASLTARVGDLHAELERIWPTALRMSKRENMSTRLPELVIRNRTDQYTSGHACPSLHRIVISVGTNADRATAEGTLAHEVVHLLTPDGEPWHSRAFWLLLVELCAAAYGTRIGIGDIDKCATKADKQVAIEAAIRGVLP